MCRAMCRKNKFCYKEAEKLAEEFHEANFFQKIKLLFVSDTKDMKKIYESVQIALNECCLNDDEQLGQIEMVRAFYNGDIGARPIGASLGTGLSSLMVALFGIECALIIALIPLSQVISDNNIVKIFDQMKSLGDFIGVLYVIMMLLIPVGLRQILYNTYHQKRSSVIVSAIDDTLKKAKRNKHSK